eukprot:2263120-Prymnesium_polylepis.1
MSITGPPVRRTVAVSESMFKLVYEHSATSHDRQCDGAGDLTWHGPGRGAGRSMGTEAAKRAADAA